MSAPAVPPLCPVLFRSHCDPKPGSFGETRADTARLTLCKGAPATLARIDTMLGRSRVSSCSTHGRAFAARGPFRTNLRWRLRTNFMVQHPRKGPGGESESRGGESRVAL